MLGLDAKMSAKQASTWESIRSRGRRNFQINVGVLRWGLPTAILWSLWMGYLRGWNELWFYAPYSLIAFPLVGYYFFAPRCWRTNERRWEQFRNDGGA